MKIGILTFHRAHNYGAVLQCFAMQEYLKSLGHQVSVIDYQPWYLINQYVKNSLRLWISRGFFSSVKKLLKEIKIHKTRIKRYNGFDQFITSYLNLSQYSPKTELQEYDIVFIGSDQVWDKDICGGKYDLVYFGEKIKCKVVPYAVSNKLTHLEVEDISFFKDKLSQFNYIGVREKKLQELLQPLTDTQIVHTVDPTLLAGSLLSQKIENKRLIKEKYILIYEVVEHKEVINLACKFAKKNGYKVVMLSAYLTDKYLNLRDQEASPSDFVNYIRHAEYVFTSSFHGTALSIIFKKKFYSFRQHTTSDERIESLLNLLGLQDRFLEMKGEIKDFEISYDLVNKKLSNNIETSKTFINNVLKNIY